MFARLEHEKPIGDKIEHGNIGHDVPLILVEHADLLVKALLHGLDTGSEGIELSA